MNKLPKITRNRLIALGLVVAGAAAVAIAQPDLARDLFTFWMEG
jgi:hypothetical protein